MNELKFPKWFIDSLDADRAGNVSKSFDIMFDNIDSLMTDSQFSVVDDVLRRADVACTSLSFLCGLLSITLPAKRHLPSRAGLLASVYNKAVCMGRNAEGLLGGLR